MSSSVQRPLLGGQPRTRSTRIFQRYFTLPEVDEPRIEQCRRSARNFLSSRWGHYLILLLVAVDVCCTFADFLIQLHVCELKQTSFGADNGWEVTQEVLSISSLVISCLFMGELVVAALSFGMKYFSDWFHVFDSLVIIVAFTIEVSLRGIGEELGSLVIVLRLWRVFQIIEELSSASEDSLEQYEQEIERLKVENSDLRDRLALTENF
ncbi:uncharacterized protein N7483_004429 [Penicillium malachiteum]|uniref:uncharacterized protein n=1 Tax=Penicillium malachiteum TaxID=1324776 RepID=UPI00254662CE|nr:uncharacterized protein N7483_004429 [Penicillium malachiteum]KAJ5729921.1 hypothetical protein N7483_004429 [Penicillium malachiteum]